jgi:hypothetical protein
MADDGKKRSPLNLDQLAKLSMPDMSAASKAMELATRAMDPFKTSSAEKALNPLREAGVAGAAMRAALGQTRGVQDAMTRAAEAMKPLHDVEERMNALRSVTGTDNALSKVAGQIAAQQRSIDALAMGRSTRDMVDRELTMPRIPDIKVPPNPLIETNKRLKRIEDRFEQIQGIAGEAASIANGLQGAAAELLGEFKVAAQENNRAARKAIWLGAMAVIVTLSVALGQIAYNEFWRVPADTQAMRDAIVEMKSEIAAVREQNAATMERLEEALRGSDDELAAAIRDLVNRLASTPQPSP